MEVASAFVSILPSAKGFGRKLDSEIGSDLGSSGKRAGSKWGSALKLGALGAAAGIGVGVAKLLGESIQAGSQAQQSIGGVEAVFGKYADSVLRDSKKAAQGLGLSAAAYNELITVSGAMLKNKGIEDFAKQSTKLVTIGADLSAQFGGSTKDAVAALNAAMRGESDPIERYGISLGEAAIKAELFARNQGALTGAALEQAKTQIRLELITRQSADAMGAFGRESNTLAGQQARLGAQWENLKATIGTALLPVLTRLVGFVNRTLLPAISSFRPRFDQANGAIRSMSGPLNSLRSIFQSTVAIITALWRKFGPTLVRYSRSSLQNILQVVRGVLQVIEGVFQTVSALIQGDWRGAWNGIKTIVAGAKNVIVGSVKQLWNLIRTAFTIGAGVVRGVMSRLWEGIKQGAANLVGVMYQAGKDLVLGLINGIKAMAGAAADAAADVVKGAINKAKDALKIGSPSRVFHQIGSWTGEGFVNGLNAKAAAVRESGRKVADSVLQGWKDRAKELRDGILQTGKDVAASVSQAFTRSDLFSGTGEAASGGIWGAMTGGQSALDQFRANLAAWKTDLTRAQGAIKSLMSQGIGGQFLQQLAASGNTGLLIELAGSGQALQLQADFAAATSQAAMIGARVGDVAMNEGFASVVTELERLGDRIEAAELVNAQTVGVVVGEGVVRAGNKAARRRRRD